jgi:hypothetical protein
MSKWVSLARDLVASARKQGEAAMLIEPEAEPSGNFVADLEALIAGEGSLTEKAVRRYLWDFRDKLKDCTVVYAKEAEGKWLLCGGTEH